MPRESQREVLADRQNPEQPALFDDGGVPVRVAVLEAVKARRYEHVGVRLLEDEAKALRLVELLMARWGVKKIAREMDISPHTVRAARRALVAQGKLAPYKQRVVEMMEDVIEAGVANYRDALEEGRVSAAQIPVGVAIMFDKRALAMGEPTSISGVGAAPDEDLKVENINAYLDTLPSCKPPAIDSASTGNATKPLQTDTVLAADDTLDGSDGQPTGTTAGPSVHPSRPDLDGQTDGSAVQGGGGGADRPEAD